MSEPLVPKALLSVVTGNTPHVRGVVVDRVLRAAPGAVVLAVSVDQRDDGYPAVQRFVSGGEARLQAAPLLSATGDPAVILRQDLLSLRRTAGERHVVLALPAEFDVLPFLVELWRTRIGSSSLNDHYDPAPLLVGLDPAPFMADIGCVHCAAPLWGGHGRSDPLTPAEAAARQVEAADALFVPVPANGAGDGERTAGVAALAGHLNGQALVVAPLAPRRN